MIYLLAILLALLTLYYSVLLLCYRHGLQAARDGTRRRGARTVQRRPFVSVIVPARNEEENIEACLEALLDASYPSERFEIIVVDDGSTDRTAARVGRLQQRRAVAAAAPEQTSDISPASVRLVPCEQPDGHKTAALQTGLAHARGEIIATTDADCLVTPGWLEAMTASLTPEVGFVAGPVRYAPARTLLERLQALESLGLVAIGAGAIGIGRPHVCNSANIMYRRSVYDEIQEAFPAPEGRPASAGEDELLLQRIAREPRLACKVAFCADPAATVRARPERTLGALFAQRRRWAATGARYPYLGVRATLGGLFLFYVVLMAALVTAWWAPALWPVVVAAVAFKVVAEGSLLLAAANNLGQRFDAWLLAAAQPLQIPYVVLMGLAAPLGPVYWKGRKIH